MKKIAVPADNGLVSAHFGHCPSFEVFEADEAVGVVLSRSRQPAPAHEPGKIPRWLKELGVDVVLSGGMGRRALELFSELGIEAVSGGSGLSVDEAVQGYLNGSLRLQGAQARFLQGFLAHQRRQQNTEAGTEGRVHKKPLMKRSQAIRGAYPNGLNLKHL